MGDQHDRPRVSAQRLFQLLDQRRRQVVGRLVEQQEIGGFRDQPGQIHPPALPVGQLTHAQAQVRGAEEAEGEQGVGVFVGGAHAAQPERLGQRQAGRPRRLVLPQVPHPAGHPHRALIRPQFTGEHLQQRGLARSVGTGDEKPPAAAEGERTQPQTVAHPHVRQVRGGQVLRDGSGAGLRDGPGRRHAGREGQRLGRRRHRLGGQPLDPLTGVADAGHRTVRPAAGPEAAMAEIGQRRLARDDAEAGGVPGGQPLVAGQFRAPLLVRLDPAAPFGRLRGAVTVVAVAVAGDLPLLGLQDRGGQALQEDTVVGDHEHRAAVCPQLRLQPLDRPVVEVVGRLVQEQQFRPAGPVHRRGRAGSAHRRRGCRAGVRGQPRQAEVVQRDVHPMVGVVPLPGLVAGEEILVRGERRRVAAVRERLPGPVQPGLQGTQVREGQVDGVLDGGRRRQGDRLGQIPDTAGGDHGHLPAVGALLTGDQPQQRGLAGAVVADQPGLLAGSEG